MLDILIDSCKICKGHVWFQILAGLNILTLIIDRWFGKTSKHPASSILEFIEMGFKGKQQRIIVMENEAIVEVGIEQLNELIDGLVVVAKAIKEIMADGKVNVADLDTALTLVQKQAVLIAAFSKLGEIKTEVKDMDMNEVQSLIAKLIQAAKDFKAA